MSEQDIGPIRPRSVPLSHTRPALAPSAPPRALRDMRWLLAIAGLVVVLALVFLVVPNLVERPSRPGAAAPAPADSTAPAATPATAPTHDAALPPFQSVLREQARENAQAELARFVELQMALESEMQVGAWGQAELDAAKTLASSGDELFVAEQFDRSLAAYRDAADKLAALIETGRGIVTAALERGGRALDERDQAAANASFDEALMIDPDNEAALHGRERAARVPEVVELLRQAKNQELAGDWSAALATYESVQRLDAETAGIDAALVAARAGVTEERVRALLSEGFARMNAGDFERARAAFREVLALKPGDPIAQGGLEQVAEQADLSRIDRLQQTAENAEREERWQDAIDGYDAVLALDPNIQFAKDGKVRATAQLRASLTLGNIIASPDKLSSAELYTDAQNVLARAQTLAPRGPHLAEQIARVEELVSIYGVPIPVTLLSDNLTQVTVSTVGRIGAFARKELSLRPGAYTLIGSRDGYRDVRTSILVRPSMAPIDIRCSEAI